MSFARPAVSLLRNPSCSRIPSAVGSRLFSATAVMSASEGSIGSAGPTEAPVLFESSGNARIYRLNRPKALNSLNHEMIHLLSGKMKAWRESDLCKLVIGLGNERGFCAGGDVKQLALDAKDGKNTGIPFFKDEFELNWLMSRLGKPYVSIIDGTTMGGGCGIALPAAIRVATSRTVFAMPETAIGYAPDVGANYYLAQLDGWVGAWLAITGQSIYGRAVYDLGIATHYVPSSSIPDLVRQMTEHTDPSPKNLSKLISSYTPAPPANGIASKANPDGSSPVTPGIRAFIDEAFSLESISAVYNRVSHGAKGEGVSEEVKKWAEEQKGIMDVKSPTGMAVALAGYRRARKTKRLDETLKDDMAMAAAFCADGQHRLTDEFLTGVTHVLIDKNRHSRAAWSKEITDPSLSIKEIEQYFKPSSERADIVPKLELVPSSGTTEKNKKDSMYGRFRQWGLPDEYSVRGLVTGDAPGSGAFAVTEQELVDRVLDRRGEVGGSRAGEMEEVVRGLVERHCEKNKDGYLTWRDQQKAKL